MRELQFEWLHRALISFSHWLFRAGAARWWFSQADDMLGNRCFLRSFVGVSHSMKLDRSVCMMERTSSSQTTKLKVFKSVTFPSDLRFKKKPKKITSIDGI